MTELWCPAASFLEAAGPVAVPLRLCCVQRLLGRAPSAAAEISCAALPGHPPPDPVFSGLGSAAEPAP